MPTFFQPGFGQNIGDEICLDPSLVVRNDSLIPVNVMSITQNIGLDDTPLGDSPLNRLGVQTIAMWGMSIIAQARKGDIPVVQST